MRSILRLFRNTFRRKKREQKNLQTDICVFGAEDQLVKEKEQKELPKSVDDLTDSALEDTVTEASDRPGSSEGTVEDKEDKECKMESLDLSRVAALRIADFPETVSAVVIDDDGKELAKQSIIKYTGTQAYVVLSALEKKIAGKAIKVSDDRQQLKLVSIEEVRENRRLLPLAAQFHSVPVERPAEAHLTDRLSEDVLGRFNLELKKNVTIDSFALNDAWRDEVGFIVSDRNRFQLLSFDAKTLLNSLSPAKDLKMETYMAADQDALADFDHSVCGFSREAAVDFLTANASVLLAKGSGSNVDGMLAAKGDRVVALYAETMEIAHALLREHIEKNKLIQVVFFSRADVWECEPASTRTVYRRHTRAVPSSIKWNKVYALNMGVHIV